MMKTVLKTSIIFLLIVLFASCKTYFTEDIRSQVNTHKINIKDIQFYTSRKIILSRLTNTNSDSAKQDSGTINFVQELEFERIVIKRNTPGVCVNAYDSELEIKFEDKDSCSLKFVINDDPLKTYVIGAQKWENNMGIVPYDGKTFFILPRSNNTRLKVKVKFLRKWKINSRVAKGVKIQ